MSMGPKMISIRFEIESLSQSVKILVNKYFTLQDVRQLLSQKFADCFENLRIKTYLILERPGGNKQRI